MRDVKKFLLKNGFLIAVTAIVFAVAVVFWNRVWGSAAVLAGFLAYAVALVYERHKFFGLVGASVEYLKRGALGDYQVLEKALRVGEELAEKILAIKNSEYPDRKAVLRIQEEALRKNREFIGISVLWEPNAFDGRDASFAGKDEGDHDRTGRFVPYCYWEGEDVKLMPLLDIEKENWYSLPKRTGEVTILDPFYFEIEGRQVLMTTVAIPIKSGNRFLGMVGIDIELQDIKKINRDVVMFSSRFKALDTSEIQGMLCNRNDEFAVLGRAIEACVANQREILGRLSKAADQLSVASKELTEIAHQSAQAAEQVAKSIEDIARSVAEQAADTEKGTSHIEELGSLLEEERRSLSKLAEAAMIVEQMKEEGSSAVSELIERTRERERYDELISEIVQKTNESAQKIGSASEMIQNIADQTNLLALNAAIEAARAGDAGRGFAVVAEEIRKLAEESMRSTKEIDAVVRELQENSRNAVDALEKSSTIAKKQEESVRLTKDRFSNISDAIERARELMAEISASNQEINARKDSIIEIFKNLAFLAERNAASSEEISASSQEQAAAMQEMSASCETLKKLADDLYAAISKFGVSG
ncbi:MAG: methyl-accepting chemotaxis protein [Thermacetogeniaceae bacterium]